VSLRLHGGAYCRPPISRTGNKAGYAEVILAALGLRSGQGADAYVWAEADPDVRALLRAYPDAAMLRRIADIIRGWKDEEPRALWERLRAERKARGAVLEDASLAGWIVGGTLWGAGVVLSGYIVENTVGKLINIDHYILPILGLVVLVSFASAFWHIFRDPKSRALLKKRFTKYFSKPGE
jgi:hypothetical protein